MGNIPVMPMKGRATLLFDLFAEKAWRKASPWVWPVAMLVTILIKLCP
jgi:hypothetical protein